MTRTSVLTVVALATAWLVGSVVAGPAAPRQYYGNWSYHKSKSYYYRNYYYKPTSNYYGYKRHVVVYKPSYDRKHYYYYNPHTKKYWGRCPATYYGNSSYHEGEGKYSALATDDQKPVLKDIPEKAFPPMAKMPKIPESKDGEEMDLPPEDPAEEKATEE